MESKSLVEDTSIENDVLQLKEMMIEMNRLVHNQKETIDQISLTVEDSGNKIEQSTNNLQSILVYNRYSRFIKAGAFVGTTALLLSPVALTVKITATAISWGIVQLV